MGKISKQLKKYPISIYGSSKESEAYKKGFERCVEIVKRLEKENKKLCKKK